MKNKWAFNWQIENNKSINILLTTHVEWRYLSIIFDDPALGPEKILHPHESVSIYPHPRVKTRALHIFASSREHAGIDKASSIQR